MNALDTSIATVSVEEFNSLFDDIPGKQPSAEDLLGGKEPKKNVKDEEIVLVGDEGLGDIQRVENLDDILSEEDDDKKKDEDKDDEDEKKDDKVDDKKKDEKQEKTDTDDKSKDDDKSPEEDKEAINAVLKRTVDFLIEKGQWLDFKGREELELDEETYAELVAQQDDARLKTMFNELVDSTGPYGKAIISFVKEGGNPDEIIDIFKEQKQIENFDTSNEDGQRQLISKYYKEVIGWKPEKIDRHIRSLIASDDLENEVTEVKELYDQYSKSELERITKEQAEYQEEQKRREESFKQNITQAIQTRTDLSPKERKLIEDSILTYKNKLPNGNVVSDFYLKFAQIQSDPKEYVELVEYVMNKDAYLKKRDTKVANKETDKIFNFVKGNVALNKKGSTPDTKYQKKDDTATFDFGLNLKK